MSWDLVVCAEHFTKCLGMYTVYDRIRQKVRVQIALLLLVGQEQDIPGAVSENIREQCVHRIK